MMSGMLVPVDESMTAVETLFGVDPEFVTLCKTLFGDDVDPLEVWTEAFAKDNPTGSDMHVMGNLQIDRRRAAQGARHGRKIMKMSDQKKRGLVAGASAAGAVAGGIGLAAGVKEMRAAGGIRRMSRLGRGLLVAEPIGLTGEVGATHFLGDDARKKRGVSKVSVGAMADGLEAGMKRVHAAATGKLIPKAKTAGMDFKRGMNSNVMGQQGPKLNSAPYKAGASLAGTPTRALATGGTAGVLAGAGANRKINKSAEDIDVVWAGEFSKFDEDKRLVFGWASVVELNGTPVVDRQGDYIHPDDLENASYDYVIKSRVGGDMHRRNGAIPFKVSDLVESMVFTPEKIEKMGLPREAAEKIPTGWWVGFKVHSDNHWDMVKKGHRAGFSIHGRGKRVPTSMDSLVAGYA